MENSHIESDYPISFREEDAKKLGEHLRHRHSVELIGMKRVGISNFLRFFLYHKEIVSKYINHGENHLFIPVDLNDLVERELYPFWALTLKRIADTASLSSLSEKSKKDISSLFLESIQSRDLFMTIENIRKSLNLIVNGGFTPTIFLLRFDRLKDNVNPEFFDNLQGLKEATGQKLAYVFTSYRTLDVLAPSVFSRKALSVFSHMMYIKPANEQDMRIIFETFEKHYNIAPSKTLLSALIDYSGGHVQYLQLSLIILNEKIKDSNIDPNELLKILLSDERITLQSEEIWESLTSDERSILLKINKGEQINEEDSIAGKYLRDTGIVIKNNSKDLVFSLLFKNYLSQNGNKKSDDETIDFSRNENKLFKFLLDNLNDVCEREKIITAVWPEYEEYGVSDWTIDRLVARLRSKLKKQKSKYSIVTVKTRGYKLVENQ